MGRTWPDVGHAVHGMGLELEAVVATGALELPELCAQCRLGDGISTDREHRLSVERSAREGRLRVRHDDRIAVREQRMYSREKRCVAEAVFFFLEVKIYVFWGARSRHVLLPLNPHRHEGIMDVRSRCGEAALAFDAVVVLAVR